MKVVLGFLLCDWRLDDLSQAVRNRAPMASAMTAWGSKYCIRSPSAVGLSDEAAFAAQDVQNINASLMHSSGGL